MAFVHFHITNPLTTVTLFAEQKDTNDIALVEILFGTYYVYKGKRTTHSNHKTLVTYGKKITRFLTGTTKELSGINLSLSGYTPFQKKVLQCAKAICWGQAVSYAELAERAGSPKAVRAVANVMRNNPFPLIVPCHRVIRKNGTLGGFGGETTGKKITLKQRLLKNEGVTLN